MDHFLRLFLAAFMPAVALGAAAGATLVPALLTAWRRVTASWVQETDAHAAVRSSERGAPLRSRAFGRLLPETLFAISLFLGCGPDSPTPQDASQQQVAEILKAEGYYRVQLHLHGSLSEGEGSMRGHNAVAHRLGTVDGLWWTDHDWRIAGHGLLSEFHFENQRESSHVPYRDTPWSRDVTHDADTFWIVNAAKGTANHRIQLSREVVAEGRHSLEIAATSRPESTEWQWVGIHLASDNRRFQTTLAADAEVELSVYPDTSNSENSQLVVRIDLSRQVEGRATLVYVLGSSGKPHRRSSDKLLGIVPVEAPKGEWTRLVLKPTRDAVELGLGGWDNCLLRIHLGTNVRRGATGRLYVDHLSLRRQRSGQEVLARAEEMAEALAQEFDLFNHIGLEISYATHMNVYLPEIELPDFEVYTHGMPPRDVVSWAHERGGVVSYNHVFGTGKRAKGETDQYEERARYLVDNQAFGADLLEVGYPHRVFPLKRHLRVWDRLSQRRVFITGIGTSDSHNQSHGWRKGNNFVSWVWATGPDRRQLIAGLASGRVFFADPIRFRGEIHLETTDGIPMGQVIQASKPSYEVVLRITDLPEGSTVRWIDQGQVAAQVEPPAGDFVPLGGFKGGRDFVQTFSVATTEYRFVRAEIWQGSRGLAFTNCLYFVPD